MKKIEMPMENHFTMFQTIADFLEDKTNLDTDSASIVAGELFGQICENANIDFTTTEEDENFLFGGLAMAFLDSLFDSDSEI